MVKFLARTGEYHFWVICMGVNENDIRDNLLWRDIESVKEFVTIFPISMDKKFIIEIKKIFIKIRGEQPNFSEKQISNSKSDIYYVIQKNLVACREKGVAGGIKRVVGKILLATNDIYDLLFEWTFAKRGTELFKCLPVDSIDSMISTYGQIGSLLLALKFKDIRKDVKWIVDYRDIIMAASSLKTGYMKRIAVEVDKKAHYITGATNSCVGSGKYPEKFSVITNGFDREDISGFSYGPKSEKLKIVYTGNLYGGKRDMTVLFRILSELEDEDALDSKKISIIYAGKQFQILEDQAKIYSMEKLLINRGELSREKALQLQYNSDILCLMTWNKTGEDNWLTGKMLEYLMMNKPVFAIVMGNRPDSLVKKIVQKANLGYCYEEGGNPEEYYDAKRWIFDRYLEFLGNGELANHSEKKILEEYSSIKMAMKFKKLIDDEYA